VALRPSDEEVRRAWETGQLLDGRSSGRSLTDVVSALVGVQAQDVRAAGLCIRARTEGLVFGDVYRAIEGRSIVLTWSLRGTRHLHLASELPWVLALCGPAFGRPGRRAEQLGIGGRVGEEAVRVLRDALESLGALTRDNVREVLAPHGVDPTGQAPIHVIRRAALEGVLCVVPMPDGKERYEPLSPQPRADRDEALASLARRYLAANGPATAADFATWSGLGAPTAKRAWTLLAADLVDVERPSGKMEILADAAATLAVDRAPGPVRLLGAFDSILLGHVDRSLLVATEHARQVNAGGGMIKPTLLIGGRVSGTWTVSRRRPDPEVTPFRPLTGREQKELGSEISDVRRFLGSERSGR
jgi:hypothetical protein